jgi:hypothetical protein
MKKACLAIVLTTLFSLPLMGFGQAEVGVSTRGPVSGSLENNSGIPTLILQYVLTQAAPQFGLTPTQLIRAYYSCNCVTVEQIGPSTYLVTYGGLGIQIVIDVSRPGNNEQRSRGLLRN